MSVPVIYEPLVLTNKHLFINNEPCQSIYQYKKSTQERNLIYHSLPTSKYMDTSIANSFDSRKRPNDANDRDIKYKQSKLILPLKSTKRAFKEINQL